MKNLRNIDILNEGTGTSTHYQGMSWRDFAITAYKAYAASTGNKNFRGDPMPDFEALPETIQTAWEVAVRHTVRVAAIPGYGTPGSLRSLEEGWEGWKPPREKERVPLDAALWQGIAQRTPRRASQSREHWLEVVNEEYDESARKLGYKKIWSDAE